jgi:hypothetical protein
MASISKLTWGMAMTTLVLGVGCSTAPAVLASLAPVRESLVAGGAAAALAAAPVRTTSTAETPIHDVLTRTDDFFITQYQHKRWNPTQRVAGNANCGPTSLAMACRAYGRVPPAFQQADPAALIRYVRQAMTGQVDERAWTYPVQVADGARRLGLNSKVVFGFAKIKESMQTPGRMVVINVNPSPAYADKLVYPYDGGHFALLTAIAGDKAYLSDPLGKEPLVISLSQLEKALTTPLGNDPDGRFVPPFNGGVLVWE